MVKHTAVQSSNIASIGYDHEARELEVKFKNGGMCRYADVEPRTHEQLLVASSVGKFFHEHIKSHKPGRPV